MEQEQRLRNIMFKIFRSRNLSYAQVRYFSEQRLCSLFTDCSFALLDEGLDLLCQAEYYEACAALKQIIDAKLKQEMDVLLIAFSDPASN